MLSDGTHNYAWDARNHLSTIDSGSTGSFVYDPAGRRATKELSGTTPTANLLTGGLDEYFTRTDTSATANFLTDALGSTIGLTNSNGAFQTQYSYEPFGSNTQSGSSGTNSVAYTGRELDGTGLYFYRSRYYSPAVGRFISEDPMGWAGGINAYAYANDNPLKFRDPLGLCSKQTCTAAFFNHLLDFTDNEKVKEIASNASTIFSLITAAATSYAQLMQQSAINYMQEFASNGVNPFPGNSMVDGYLNSAETAQNLAEASEALDGVAGGIAGESVPAAVSSASGATAAGAALLGSAIADEGYAIYKQHQDYKNGNCITEVEILQMLLEQ